MNNETLKKVKKETPQKGEKWENLRKVNNETLKKVKNEKPCGVLLGKKTGVFITELYFLNYSCIVIILFSTGLYKSAFSIYSFAKTRF